MGAPLITPTAFYSSVCPLNLLSVLGALLVDMGEVTCIESDNERHSSFLTPGVVVVLEHSLKGRHTQLCPWGI